MMEGWNIKCASCGNPLDHNDPKDWNRHVVPMKSCALTHTVTIGDDIVYLCKKCERTKVVVENYMGRVVVRTKRQEASRLRAQADELFPVAKKRA